MKWSQLLRRYLRRLPPGSGDFTQDLDKFLPGNRLTLLNSGGEAYRAMWEAIDSARQTVHLETYILASDATGREFGRRLMAKARQGVSVRLIFDSVGSLDIDPAFLTQLRNAGVHLLEYHPLAPWRSRWAWSHRDHRKILAVDGRLGFSGDVNISHDHAPRDEGGGVWHDTHIRVEGPAAQELDRLFREVWFRETRRFFAPADAPAVSEVPPTVSEVPSVPAGRKSLPPAQVPAGRISSRPAPKSVIGDSLVWVAANQEFLHRHRIRRAFMHALRAARQQVCIVNSYFLPDLGIRRALAAAARRGAAVRILVPGYSDHTSVWQAGRRTYDMLLRNGVRIFEWTESVLHTKSAVVDGAWCAVGSYNMDHLSLRHNLEVNLHVLDAQLASRMEARFAADLVRSRELKLDGWRRRPWTDKLRERFWYQFRYFF